MANQDSHGSNVPIEVNQKPMQPIPNRFELDINPNLSLGRNGSGNYYPILPLENPPPPPSSYSSSAPGRRGSAIVLNGDKENADLIKQLQARRRCEVRRKLSWKKKAREANKRVVPKYAKFGIFAMPLGTPKPLKLSPVKIDDPAQTRITPFAVDNNEATLMYTKLADDPESPYKIATIHDDIADMSLDELLQLMRVMPRVTTSGGIRNGRVTEGVLVKFLEPRNVLIVCLCHGHFLSPKEFVKHACGLDLSNYLKLIKVEP